MKPSGSWPSYGWPGNCTVQFGVTRQKLSQRPRHDLSDASSLEHDVIDARPRELVADDQPGLSPADDDHVDPLAHEAGECKRR